MATLMTCRIGTGFTAASKFLVRKSKKNLGQKKPSIAPASWSGRLCQSLALLIRDLATLDLQHADVRIMSRAQWFFISLPMLLRGAESQPAGSRSNSRSWYSYDNRCGSHIAL